MTQYDKNRLKQRGSRDKAATKPGKTGQTGHPISERLCAIYSPGSNKVSIGNEVGRCLLRTCGDIIARSIKIIFIFAHAIGSDPRWNNYNKCPYEVKFLGAFSFGMVQLYGTT